MKLTDLDARLMKWTDDLTLHTVESVPEADCVTFLCPLCFKANGGPVGTHSVIIPFSGRVIPEKAGIHDRDGRKVFWNVSGNNLSDLTTTPSILLFGGCGWHGYITSGDAA